MVHEPINKINHLADCFQAIISSIRSRGNVSLLMFENLKKTSHPDVLQLVLQEAPIRLLQSRPLVISTNISSLTLDDDLEEHHLLGEATEAIVEADLIVSLMRRLHPGITGSKVKDPKVQHRAASVIWGMWGSTNTWTPSERRDSTMSRSPSGETMVKSTSIPAPAITWMCTSKYMHSQMRSQSFYFVLKIILFRHGILHVGRDGAPELGWYLTRCSYIMVSGLTTRVNTRTHKVNILCAFQGRSRNETLPLNKHTAD